MDSTGIAAIAEKDRLIYKRALPGYDFVHTKMYNAVIDRTDTLAVLGHNRLATHGTICDDNAHPFKDKHIILTHNGVVNGYVTKDFDVDSKWVAHLLAEEGVEGLKKVQGSFALVWHDSVTEAVHFCRNDARDFWYAICPKIDTLFYASERGMLEWILARENIELKEITKVESKELYTISVKDLSITRTPVQFYQAPVNQHHYQGWKNKFNGYFEDDELPFPNHKVNQNKLPNLKTSDQIFKELGLSKKDWVVATIEDIHPSKLQCSLSLEDPEKKYLNKDIELVLFFKKEDEREIWENIGYPVLVELGGHARAEQGTSKYVVYCTDLQIVDLDKELATEVDKSNNMQEMLDNIGATDDIPAVPGPNKEFISLNEFNKLTKHGCSMCSGNILEKDVYHMSWFNGKEPICPACTTKEIHAGEGYVRQ